MFKFIINRYLYRFFPMFDDNKSTEIFYIVDLFSLEFEKAMPRYVLSKYNS
jgi:hypothetical protein